MVAWGAAMKVLLKWGPVVYAAARKSWPYVKDNPAAQQFLSQLTEQTTRIPEHLSPDLRNRRKIQAVRDSLAEAAALGIDPVQYADWRRELDDLERLLVLAKAATRRRRRAVERQVSRRLDRLVAEILPALVTRRPGGPSGTAPPPVSPPGPPPALPPA